MVTTCEMNGKFNGIATEIQTYPLESQGHQLKLADVQAFFRCVECWLEPDKGQGVIEIHHVLLGNGIVNHLQKIHVVVDSA